MDPDNPSSVILHPNYRKDSTNHQEFVYFIARILSRMNPSQRNFVMEKRGVLLSSVHNPRDEAYGLMLMYISLVVWEQQQLESPEG